MYKDDVVHIYNGTSHKKEEILPFSATWMNLEMILLSKVSKKLKDKYYMISFIHEI